MSKKKEIIEYKLYGKIKKGNISISHSYPANELPEYIQFFSEEEKKLRQALEKGEAKSLEVKLTITGEGVKEI